MMRASKLAFTVVCGPVICCYVVFAACCCPGRLRRRPESEEKKHFERRQKLAPRPLPVRPIERSLTVPLPKRDPEKDASVSEPRHGGTLEQTQSRLMRLPPELRQMIFKAVVGEKVMHIVLKENKLGYVRCRAPSTERCGLAFHGRTVLSRECCWGSVDSANIWASNVDGDERLNTDGDIIPFLSTCRQIYSESIKLLYSSNTFSFSDLDCLRYFSCTTLPQRFSLVQALDLDWYMAWPIYDPLAQNILHINPALYPPNDEATWEETWRIIAEMPNLRFLRATLLYLDEFRDPTCEEKMLAPLMKVTKPKKFEVHVTWEGEDIENAPFELIRP